MTSNSNMWELAAIVEVLERKGLCAKQDLYEIIAEFRRKNPRAAISETAFPEPYLLTEIENTIIDDILELLNKHALTSHQSPNLLQQLGGIIEMGQRVAKGTTHEQGGRYGINVYKLEDLLLASRLNCFVSPLNRFRCTPSAPKDLPHT